MEVTASSPVVALLGLWFTAFGLLGVALVRDHRGWLTRVADRRAAMGVGYRDSARDRRQQQFAAVGMAIMGLGFGLFSAAVLVGRALS